MLVLYISQCPKFTAQKINHVIKQIFTAIAVSAFIFSCNNNGSKNVSEKESKVQEDAKAERNDNLVYLDTAENINNILCQDWV
jgi:hypothetical protein